MIGVHIKTDNTIEITDFEAPLFESLGKAVNGYIEIVHPVGLEYPLCMIVNEEGLIRGLPQNMVGSILFGWLSHRQPIVGDIVIMKEGLTSGGPDIVGLNEQEIQDVLAAVKQIAALK